MPRATSRSESSPLVRARLAPVARGGCLVEAPVGGPDRRADHLLEAAERDRSRLGVARAPLVAEQQRDRGLDGALRPPQASAPLGIDAVPLRPGRPDQRRGPGARSSGRRGDRHLACDGLAKRRPALRERLPARAERARHGAEDR
jgi:hypothetical protein